MLGRTSRERSADGISRSIQLALPWAFLLMLSMVQGSTALMLTRTGCDRSGFAARTDQRSLYSPIRNCRLSNAKRSSTSPSRIVAGKVLREGSSGKGSDIIALHFHLVRCDEIRKKPLVQEYILKRSAVFGLPLQHLPNELQE